MDNLWNQAIYQTIQILRTEPSIRFIHRITSMKNSVCVIPHLFLGNFLNAKNEDFLKEYKIEYIVNCTDSEPFHDYILEENKLRVPVKDSKESDNIIEFISYINSAVEFIHKAIKLKKNVYVHCHYGLMRSPTVIIAYLMKYEKMNKSMAIDWVKNKRPGSFSSLYNFDSVINNYEEYLKKKE